MWSTFQTFEGSDRLARDRKRGHGGDGQGTGTHHQEANEQSAAIETGVRAAHKAARALGLRSILIDEPPGGVDTGLDLFHLNSQCFGLLLKALRFGNEAGDDRCILTKRLRKRRELTVEIGECFVQGDGGVVRHTDQGQSRQGRVDDICGLDQPRHRSADRLDAHRKILSNNVDRLRKGLADRRRACRRVTRRRVHAVERGAQ